MRAFLVLIIFLACCGIDDPIVNTGNGKTDIIQEAWVENRWMYNKNGNIVKDSTLQLQMLLENSSKDTYQDIWFKQNGQYLGWVGVCYGTYQASDSIIVSDKKGKRSGNYFRHNSL